jgi:uncharacterized NAD(P)/FAD-binding protein YdhS
MRKSPDINHQSRKQVKHTIELKARYQLMREVATLVAFITTANQLWKQVMDARNEKI